MSDRPNVVVIVLDDMGFGQLGCFGSDIETPHVDALAAGGLRYNRFHVTAICSPTRASLLTGRNHHAVGMGLLPDLPLDHPGYTGRIPAAVPTLPGLLRDAGYSTYAVGKWHLTPRDERSASGPFTSWPLGLGFERYYGFLHGDANHWTPLLVSDNHYVEPPRRPEDGYHLSADLADAAIRMLLDQHHATPRKPFFLYVAPGAVHAPHHVPTTWADRYRGRFDDGWERARERTFARQLELGVVPAGTELPERPSWIEPWDELPAAHRAAFARMHEVFAGFLSHIDHQIGRVLGLLDTIGRLDDTIVLFLSDNGASAEGGRLGSRNEHRFGYGLPETAEEVLAGVDELGGFRSYNHYAWGWAWSGNTPLKMWKRYTWLGGSRVPLIVGGAPGAAETGSVRDQLCHVVDVAPTVLELCGVEVPEGLDGASLTGTFGDPQAPAPRDTQYFELLGSRSIYAGHWKATTDHVSQGVLDEERLVPGSRDFDDDHWALFDLRVDFAEARDVSAEHPDVVRDLRDRWDAEAERNQVLPMHDGLQSRLGQLARPLHPVPRHMVYRPGGGPVAYEMVPSLGGGGRAVATVDVPGDGGSGVLFGMGDWTNGWALVVLDGRLTYLLSAVGEPHRIVAADVLPVGRHDLGFEFEPSSGGGGEGRLLVDGDAVAAAPLPPTFGWASMQIGPGGLCIGYARGFPVSDDYRPPFPWTGTLHHVTMRSGPPLPSDIEGEVREVLHRE